MAIDIRQEQLQRSPQRVEGPAPHPRRRGAWTMVLGVAAIIAVVGALTVVVLQEDTAPVSGAVSTYPEVAATAEREGGEYLVVPERVAEYSDTLVEIREGGTGSYLSPMHAAMQQKAGMVEVGVRSLAGTPVGG